MLCFICVQVDVSLRPSLLIFHYYYLLHLNVYFGTRYLITYFSIPLSVGGWDEINNI